MAGVAVASLDLALKLPGGLRSQASSLERRTREDFIPAMLRAMERKLAAYYGEHAVIRIRRLDLKLKISAAEIASPELAETVAEDFAELLKSQAVLPGPRDWAFPGEVPLVVYADPAHYAAVRLAAAAQRSPGPDGEKEALDRVWSELRSVPRATLARAMVRLYDGERLSPTLAALPSAAVRGLPRELGPELPTPVLRAIVVELAMRNDAPATRTLSGEVEPVAESVTAKSARYREDIGPQPQTEFPESGRPGEGWPATRAEPVARNAEPINAGADDTAPPDSAELPVQPDPASRRTEEQSHALPTAAMPTPHSAPPKVESAVELLAIAEPAFTDAEPLRFASRWCGLAYLLRIALLCEIPERLWQIGVDEGAAFARALGLVAGEPDPVWLILSVQFPDPPKPLGYVPAWALEELRGGAIAAGVAMLGDKTARAELDASIAAWIARLDAASEDAVSAWIAAFLLAMFGLLSGSEVVGGVAAASQFAKPGQVLVDGDEVTVVQPLAQIALAVRRAGLDADPGWLAWRRLTLRLAFVGDETLP